MLYLSYENPGYIFREVVIEREKENEYQVRLVDGLSSKTIDKRELYFNQSYIDGVYEAFGDDKNKLIQKAIEYMECVEQEQYRKLKRTIKLIERLKNIQ